MAGVHARVPEEMDGGGPQRKVEVAEGGNVTSEEDDLPERGWQAKPHGRALHVGVIGCGYWGPHLVRNLHETAGVEVLGVSDLHQDRLEYIGTRYPGLGLFPDPRVLPPTGLD